MTLTEDFGVAVAALSAETPYTVTADDDGFDVHIDLADARFYSLFTQHRLSKIVIHRIRVDEEARTFTMLDIARSVEWGAGVAAGERVPRLSGSMESSRGRIISFSRQKIYAWDEHLQYGKVVDYDFSSNEGHSLVRAGAARVDLTERLPGVAKGALIVAGITVALIVLSGVGVLIAWLTGAF